MFMVDCIKLNPFNQIEKMWKLERDRTLRLQENIKAGNEVMDVRNMGKHICRVDEIRVSITSSNLFCDTLPKELHNCLDPFL